MAGSTALSRRNTREGFHRLIPELHDSRAMAAIKEAFGLSGWMDFINLANIKYRATGGRGLISQIRYDAAVVFDEDANLAVRFILGDGETVTVTIPDDWPNFDIEPIRNLIPIPEIPILDFTMPDNLVWLATVVL